MLAHYYPEIITHDRAGDLVIPMEGLQRRDAWRRDTEPTLRVRFHGVISFREERSETTMLNRFELANIECRTENDRVNIKFIAPYISSLHVVAEVCAGEIESLCE